MPRAINRRRIGAALAAIALAAGAGLWWSLHRVPAAVMAKPSPAPPARPSVNGRWQADVDYDWPNAHFTERFEFDGDGSSLRGSASFLGVPRGIEEGRVDEGGVSFATRTAEAAGGAGRDTVHRYAGRLIDGDELRFTMQTEGASTPHVPVSFTARRFPR